MPTTPKAHHSHVERLLQQVDANGNARDASFVPLREEDYLGPVEEGWLWELVGFRLRGHPWTLLALVQFRIQSSSAQPHGRVSLVQHLTSPAHAHRSGEVRPPGEVLPVVPVPTTVEVPDFLERIRNGRVPPVTWLDRASIQLAFDFRVESPSAPAGTNGEKPGQRRFVRTTEGHVMEGRAAALHAKLHRDFEFIALLDGAQRTPDATLPLPTLILSRGYLAAELASTKRGDGGPGAEEREAESTLFSPEYASSEPLLR